MDAWGGVHPIGIGQAAPALPVLSACWHGWDVVRAIWLEPSATLGAVSGYVLEGYGGLHQIGGAPVITRSTYWRGWDIAIGLAGA